MSQDLFRGNIDPVTGYPLGELGFSFKSIEKKVKKVAGKVVRVAAPVASFLPIPGAGLVSRAMSSGLAKKVTSTVKKVEAVKKAVTPSKPPPRQFYAAPKKLPIIATANRPGTPSRKASGVLPFKSPVKPVLKAAPKAAPKSAAKPTVLKTQAAAAGITFKKRAKKGGGTETVAVDKDGAVVSAPIPAAVIARAGVPVSEGVLSVDAVQASAPAIPSAQSASYSNGGGGSGVAPYSMPEAAASSEPATGGLFDNPLVLVGAAAVGLLVVGMRR